MEIERVNGIDLFYKSQDVEILPHFIDACQRSVDVITRTWHFAVPSDCRIYLMSSWAGFMLHSAPLIWRIWMGLTFPLWFNRVRKLWRYAGGWSQRYGQRHAVGVKLPHLLKSSDGTFGNAIFTPEDDVIVRFGQVLCHELTHACSAHLGLPAWLNEGLAMVAVDKYTGKPTVREDTLNRLHVGKQVAKFEKSNPLELSDYDATVTLYVLGYWLVRYLAETDIEFLRILLKSTHSPSELEAVIAKNMEISPDSFWPEVIPILVHYFDSL